MTILAPNGKPITSQRRVTLTLEIRDTTPYTTNSTAHRLAFELDSASPTAIRMFTQKLGAMIEAKLREIGFTLGSESVASPVAGVRPDDPMSKFYVPVERAAKDAASIAASHPRYESAHKEVP